MIKKPLLLIIALSNSLSAKWPDLGFGVGPTQLNLIWLDKTTLLAQDLFINTLQTTYKINESSGVQVDANASYEINEFLNPIIDFSYSKLTKGNGFIETVAIKDKKVFEVVTFATFVPNITVKSISIKNQINLSEKKTATKTAKLSAITGYNYNKFVLISQAEDESGTSTTNCNAFLLEFKLDISNDSPFSYGVSDSMSFNKLSTTSSGIGFLGKDSGTTFYKLIGNTLTPYANYKLNDKWNFGLSFGWTYMHSIGCSRIRLGIINGVDFNTVLKVNLCKTAINQFTLMFNATKSF